MTRLIKIKITYVNHTTGHKDIVIGKIEPHKLEYFYSDRQGWIFIDGKNTAIIYKFDINKIVDSSHKCVLLVDRERLRKAFEPLYITGMDRSPSVSNEI